MLRGRGSEWVAAGRCEAEGSAGTDSSSARGGRPTWRRRWGLGLRTIAFGLAGVGVTKKQLVGNNPHVMRDDPLNGQRYLREQTIARNATRLFRLLH